MRVVRKSLRRAITASLALALDACGLLRAVDQFAEIEFQYPREQKQETGGQARMALR
jgi:hypothetical protein